MNTRAKSMNNDLVASVDNVVTDLNVYRIYHSGTQMSLTGAAATEQEVMQYVRKLQDTGRFAEITISNIIRVTSENASDVMEYTLALKLEKH
jgi:hypothetical protein